MTHPGAAEAVGWVEELLAAERLKGEARLLNLGCDQLEIDSVLAFAAEMHAGQVALVEKAVLLFFGLAQSH